MVSKISEGILISVETYFQPEFSDFLSHEFMFAYKITITNENDFPVQLLHRHWYIFDSVGEHREVDGAGVVGEQPTLLPGKTYSYMSGCNLNSEIGRMHGYYQFSNLHTKKIFKAQIPAFDFITPMKKN